MPRWRIVNGLIKPYKRAFLHTLRRACTGEGWKNGLNNAQVGFDSQSSSMNNY